MPGPFRPFAAVIVLCPLLSAATLTISAPLDFSQAADSKQMETPGASAEIQSALRRAQNAELARRYSEASKILRAALREHPGETALQLELGRVYLANGEDGKAQRLFEEILAKNPTDREAQLELARALAYQLHYESSDAIYQRLLATNPADEAAAIGLTSNLTHQGQHAEAAAVADAALHYHPNSLRLLEYKDRIASGLLGGEERAPRIAENFFSTSADYVDDSAGNHSWRVFERLGFKIRPELTSDLLIEQQFLHSLDDPSEAVQTFYERLRWKPLERLAMSAGGGATRFDKGDVRAIYDITVTGQLARHLLAGGGFSRIPIVPDAEAAEHKLAAQGWEAFGLWTPDQWQVNVRVSGRHYSDGNTAEQQWAEALHQWTTTKVDYLGGVRFRHYAFSKGYSHGYFSPDNYQSYQATVGAVIRPWRRYRAELTAQVGAETIASGTSFQPAWELSFRNQLLFRKWTLSLDYSRYHMAQATGAYRADAARFEFAYHF